MQVHANLGLRPISANLFGMFFFKFPQSRHPERSACDFFDFSSFWHTQPECFSKLHKTVILSEAPHRFIA
jgi:hypothetical protein